MINLNLNYLKQVVEKAHLCKMQTDTNREKGKKQIAARLMWHRALTLSDYHVSIYSQAIFEQATGRFREKPL